MIEIRRILCPIDFSEFSDHALRYAMKFAAWYGAKLHVFHVMPPMTPTATNEVVAATRLLVARRLVSAAERRRKRRVDVATELRESAHPSATILQRAEALDVDLIVTGSHGRKGMQRVLWGSVVEPLLHRARQPVLVIPAGLDPSRLERLPFARMMCAVDFSVASLTALEYAFAMAEEADATLTLVNVSELPLELVHPPQPPDFNIERARADAEAERLSKLRALVPEHAREYCSVRTAVAEGSASRQILRLAEQQQADLIVLGVHGRNALDLAVFGSNSKDIITRAHCPVLVVPAGRRREGVRVPSRIRHAEPAFVA